MKREDVEIDKEYKLTYPTKRKSLVLVKVLQMDSIGDCKIKFKNNRTDSYNCCWLEEV